MKRLRLNLLNGKNNDSPVYKTEEEFWKMYVTILNVNNIGLTEKEIDVMAYVLSCDPYASMFKGKRAKMVCEKMGFGEVRLHQLIKSLEAKGIIYNTGEHKRDYLPHNSIRKLQLYIKDNFKNLDSIDLLLPFKL